MPDDNKTTLEEETQAAPEAPEQTETPPAAAPVADPESPTAAPAPEKPAEARTAGGITLPHLASRIFGVPLAIMSDKLATILTVMGPKFFGGEPVILNTDMPAHAAPVGADGIAVIPIVGTLVKRATPGASTSDQTYGEIEAAVLKAVNDQSIMAIVLDIDSPGGEVNGMLDLTDTIYKARGAKPIVAVCNEWACSAAYAIASAADRIVIPRTGTVGSVGVIAVHVDQSKWDAQEGLKFTTITAGARKADFDPHAPLSEEAQTILQAEVDRIYGLFVDTVARNRGMSAEAVRKTQAGVYSGDEAIKAGFADEIGTLNSALAGIFADAAKRSDTTQQKAAMTAMLEQAQDLNVQIARACNLAGMPELTADFQERRLPLAEVGKDLQRRRASKDTEEIHSHLHPATPSAKTQTIDKAEDIYTRRRALTAPAKLN